MADKVKSRISKYGLIDQGIHRDFWSNINNNPNSKHVEMFLDRVPKKMKAHLRDEVNYARWLKKNP